ncbi:MAG: PASTA domain-containing protein [Saprospirales bacterium]|nr:MAG: PASTA domain-containing protein [Saprospirales bacterium]
MAKKRTGKDLTTGDKLKALALFLVSKTLWKNLLLMAIAGLVIVFLTHQSLKWYTRHGQQIPLPDYTGESINSAMEDADNRSFRMVVSDSIYIVGRRGGIILDQIPQPHELVKKDRKIYVTVTKSQPDMVTLDELPPMYGRSFERTARVLQAAHNIDARIMGKTYDPGPEGHIMLMIFEGDTIIDRGDVLKSVEIPVGATVGFIVSEQRGGMVEIPNVVCRSLDEAEFIISSHRLRVGSTRLQGEVEDLQRAFVVEQDPPYKPDEKIRMGRSINLILSREQPDFCDPEPEEF